MCIRQYNWSILTRFYTCHCITLYVLVETQDLARVSHSLGLPTVCEPFLLYLCFKVLNGVCMILAHTGRHVTAHTEASSPSQSFSLALLLAPCMFLAYTGGGVTSDLLRGAWLCECAHVVFFRAYAHLSTCWPLLLNEVLEPFRNCVRTPSF